MKPRVSRPRPRPATRLTFGRHGHARSNSPEVVTGAATCTGLTEIGRDQAQCLAQRLCLEEMSDPVAAVYATRVQRVLQTAQIVAGALGLSVHHLDCLRYPRYGEAEGRRWDEVYAAFTDAEGVHPAMRPDLPLAPGAESLAEFREPMGQMLDVLVERHHGEHVLVFGSVENILAVSELAQGLPIDAWARSKFVVEHTSLTTWEYMPAAWAPGGGRWLLTRANDCAHLTHARRRTISRSRGPSS